jgi:hypothetical protein
MNVSYILLFVSFVGFATAQPVLSGYAHEFDVSSTFYMYPANGVYPDGVKPYYKFYYEVSGQTFRMGIVCEAIGGWFSFGWSANGKMISAANDAPNDGVVLYVDENNVTSIADMVFPATTNAPNMAACAAEPFDNVCPDASKALPEITCQNSATVIRGYRVGNYSVAEFQRPLAASDACDLAIPIDQAGYVLYAVGQIFGVDPFPYNIIKHVARSNEFSTYSFDSSPSTTGVQTTGPATTGPATTGPATTGVVTTGSVTTGSCNNLSQQCTAFCGDKVVTLCRCVNNAMRVECGEANESSTVAASLAVAALAVAANIM